MYIYTVSMKYKLRVSSSLCTVHSTCTENLQIPNVKKTKRGNLKLASTTGHQSHVATIHHMDVGLTHTLATESSTLLSLMTLPAGVSYRVSVLAAKGGGTSTKPANLNIKGQGSPINAYGYGKCAESMPHTHMYSTCTHIHTGALHMYTYIQVLYIHIQYR